VGIVVHTLIKLSRTVTGSLSENSHNAIESDYLLNVICIILHSVADSEDISGVFRLHIFLTKFEE
jgi:hypothetical protein